MSLTIEDGSGVAGANSYILPVFVTTYLTDRNRLTENTWNSRTSIEMDAAVIAATDYIETRFSLYFKGQKEFLSIQKAKGTFSMPANPADTETVTIGSTVYTFNTVLSGAYSILIGENPNATLNNLIAAINFSTGIGSVYGNGTSIHPDISAKVFEGDAIVISAKTSGLAGNLITTTTTVTGASWGSATLKGGSDTGQPQPLSFPRINLFDSDGAKIIGIPEKVKQAAAEYAVRAVAASLIPDPGINELNGHIISKKEKVGPIEEETQYSNNAPLNVLSRPYPAADRLLASFMKRGGLAVR